MFLYPVTCLPSQIFWGVGNIVLKLCHYCRAYASLCGQKCGHSGFDYYSKLPNALAGNSSKAKSFEQEVADEIVGDLSNDSTATLTMPDLDHSGGLEHSQALPYGTATDAKLLH